MPKAYPLYPELVLAQVLAQERQTGFHEVWARVRDDLLHRCPPAQSVVAFRIDPLAKF